LEELARSGIVAVANYTSRSTADSNWDALDRSSNTGGQYIGGMLAGHLNYTFCKNRTKELTDRITNEFRPLAEVFLNTKHCRVSGGGNINMPGSVNQHWHADSQFSKNFLVINYLLVDIDELNGATIFALNTQEKPVDYFDFLVGKYFFKWKFSSSVGLQKGAIVLRDSNLWHRASSNKSKSPRPMLSITFYRSDYDSTDIPDLPVGLRDNWFTASSRYKELLYVYFPLLYSTKRLVGSILSRLKK
jgi:hypothetical protein